MTEVAIVGAGLGGLTLALALARAGWRPRVYEQAPALAEVGAGITISPNAYRVLAHLGLEPELERLGYVPERQWTQHWRTGDVLIETRRGPDMQARYGAGYTHLHRADLHRALVRALETLDGDAIRLGHRLVTADGAGRAEFANGASVEADVLVGADGLRSVVRETLFRTQPPFFTGQVAWRGMVPAEALPPELRGLPPGIHVGPQRLFLRYPVRGGTLLNYAAFVELEGWEEESWSLRSTVAELLGHFEGWDPAVRTIIAATPGSEIYKWALHAREPLDTWVAGRAVLVGDAAHAMLPFMGQGAATAIEDGMVLARALARYAVPEALARYEAVRRGHATAVQMQSRMLGLKLQGRNPEELGRGPLQNEETLGLFAYDAVGVPV